MRLGLAIVLILQLLSSRVAVAQPQVVDTSQIDLLILIVTAIPDADKVENFQTDSSLLTGNLNFQEFLSSSTPVFIKNYGVNGVSGFSMRGGKSDQTKIYWKDIDLNYPSLGSVDLNLIPSLMSSSASVKFGQAGISSGTGSLGGSVNLDLPYYSVDSIFLMVHSRLSSLQNIDNRIKFRREWKRFKTTLVAEQGMGRNYFTFVNPTKEGWPRDTMENADFNYQTFGADFVYKSSKKSEFNLSAWYRKHYRELPPIVSVSKYYGEAMDDQLAVATLGYRFKGKGYRVNARTAYVFTENQYMNPQIDLHSVNETSTWQNMISVYSHDDDYRWFMPWEGQLRYHREMANSENVSVRSVNRLSAYGKTSLHFRAKYKLNLAARAEFFGDEFSGILPNIGLIYKPTNLDQFIASVSYSGNLRFPTLNDLYWSPGGNPNLKAEKAKMYEARVSSKLDFRGWKVKSSLSAYYGITDNWIQWLPVGNVWSPRNVKSVTTHGVEWAFGFKRKFNKILLELGSKVNYAVATNRESYADQSEIIGKDLIYVPRWNALVNAKLAFKTWALNYSQPYTGRYFLSSDNQSYMPAYSVWNMSLSKALSTKSGRFNFAFGVRNLLDWKYQVVPSRATMGRHFTLDINFMLSK